MFDRLAEALREYGRLEEIERKKRMRQPYGASEPYFEDFYDEFGRWTTRRRPRDWIAPHRDSTSDGDFYEHRETHGNAPTSLALKTGKDAIWQVMSAFNGGKCR